MILSSNVKNYTLENFEGSLEFLLYLIQKQEVDITEISIQEITEQYKLFSKENPSIDFGAEFIGTSSFLLWLKSKKLLPLEKKEEEEELDPQFEVIYQLIDYCKFKQAATSLQQKELENKSYYLRGDQKKTPTKVLKPLNEQISLEELSLIVGNLIQRAEKNKGSIHEEKFKLPQKIHFIKSSLKEEKELSFDKIFNDQMCKEELITTFLAILELMKQGFVIVKTKSICLG